MLLLGCQQGPETAPVTGKVLFRDQPLKFGTVMFQRESGGQPARGKIQSDGTFQLSSFVEGDGAMIGTHKVRITCYSSQDPARQTGPSPGGETLGKLLIPQRYTMFGTSGLTATVKSGENPPFEFKLTER